MNRAPSTNGAEFFAVATETFSENRCTPDLYEQLQHDDLVDPGAAVRANQ